MLSSIGHTVTIAEIGINHNGNLDIAKKLIEIAADAGCDAVKFQKRTIDVVYSQEELDKPRESPWGTTTRDQKYGLEFTEEQYDEIDRFCKKKNIDWFASCWDEQSVDFISKYQSVTHHKVASALLTNDSFLRKLVASGRDIILSTGMSTVAEIDHAIDVIGKTQLDTIMHCTSTYPSQPSEMNMDVIRSMVDHRYISDGDPESPTRCFIPGDVRIGFSNHYSGLIWVPIAVAMGAKVLEFHITLDRTMYGSDQAASIEPEGVRRLVEGARVTESMLGSGFKRVYDSEIPILKKLRR